MHLIAFCNVAKAKWPIFGFPTVLLKAEDRVTAEAHALGFKITFCDIGVDMGAQTGTWIPGIETMKKRAALPAKRSIEEVQKNLFGFSGPEISCPSQLPVNCGVGKCTSTVEECIMVRGIELAKAGKYRIVRLFVSQALTYRLAQWNFLTDITSITSFKYCTPKNNGATDCTSVNSTKTDLDEWLPEGYVDNFLCACDAIPDDTNLANCKSLMA